MDLQLDESGDLAIEDNDVVLIEGVAEVAQGVRQRLRTFLGEWFLDATIGLPYFQSILTKGVKLERIAPHFKRAIIRSPGVTELIAFDQELDRGTRRLSVKFDARAFDGSRFQGSEVIG